MNNKHLLITLFATAFAGNNLVASENISPETTGTKIKTFKAITDKVIRRGCRETNSDLCKELEAIMSATDSIDFEKAGVIADAIKEELKNHNILKGIINEAKEIIEIITPDSEKSE